MTDATDQPPLPEPAAHMFPLHLAKFAGGEMGEIAYSVPVRSPELGPTAPLYTAQQMREYRDAPAWLPISTAPKDGTSVLLWERWSTNPFVGSFYGGSWSASKEHVDAAGGWDGGVVVDKIDSHLITHWQPLPPSPIEQSGEKP